MLSGKEIEEYVKAKYENNENKLVIASFINMLNIHEKSKDERFVLIARNIKRIQTLSKTFTIMESDDKTNYLSKFNALNIKPKDSSISIAYQFANIIYNVCDIYKENELYKYNKSKTLWNKVFKESFANYYTFVLFEKEKELNDLKNFLGEDYIKFLDNALTKASKIIEKPNIYKEPKIGEALGKSLLKIRLEDVPDKLPRIEKDKKEEILGQKVATELFQIIYLMPKEDIKKVPTYFLELLHKEKQKRWKAPSGTYEINLRSISEDTKRYLAYLYLNYILEDNEKESYKSILESNEKRNKEKGLLVQDKNNIINILRRFLYKINSYFKRLH